MKIIFLDIDGVLCLSTNGFNFDTECIDNLIALAEKAEARVVLCSSWKEDTLEKSTRYLPGKLKTLIKDQTPNLPGKKKGDEVQEYIQRVPADSYVILDDEPDHYLLHQRESHLVTTDRRTGLTAGKCKEAEWNLKC